MTATILGLLLAIVVVVVRGDQLGIRVQSYGPLDTVGSRATLRVTFDEPINASSLASTFAVDPPVAGKILVIQNQVAFSPAEPYQVGQAYTVTLKAGVQATTGQVLKHDLSWRFRVGPPRVVYLGPVDNRAQNLYLVDPSQPVQPAQPLTSSQEGVFGFDVAPDGSSIVYAAGQGQGTASLFVWDTATRTSRLLYECPDAQCSDPVWRPDGGAIAFERVNLNSGTGMAPGAPRVWILDLATSSVHPLFSDNQQLGYQPRWSPDGTRLAVVNANAQGIVVHDFTSGTDKTITAYQGEVGPFSPDGRWLYFPRILDLGDQHGVTHLTLVDVSADPYVQHDLVADSDPVDDVEAAWLPDSKGLVVARRPANSMGLDSPQLYTVDIATRQATPLTTDPAYSEGSPVFSPAGDVLVFERFPVNKPGARPEVWTVNLATRDLRLIAQNGFMARWLP